MSSATADSFGVRGQRTLASLFRPTTLLLIFYAVHSFVGLSYEVVWIKYLTGTLGMTLPAFAVVLGTFMAGLGIGSFVLSHLTKHSTPFYLRDIASSLVSFALLQAAIGILGMVFPTVLYHLDSLYVVLAPETEGFHHVLIRCVFAGLLLLPITSLLGTGFPLLAGLSTKLVGNTSSQRPGLVYYVGLLASALGALGSLAMIPAWGLFLTSSFLGLLNLGIASISYLLSLTWRDKDRFSIDHISIGAVSRKDMPPTTKAQQQSTLHAKQLILGIGSMTGFLVLGLEIVGAQYLWLVINATAYSEGLLFASILLGMGLGSTVYLAARSRFSLLMLLSVGFLCATCSQMALIYCADSIASIFDQFLHRSGLGQEWIGDSPLRFFIASGALTYGILGFPAMGYGLSFCCLSELVIEGTISPSPAYLKSEDQQTSSACIASIARLYAWHNWGSVAGVLITSFVFIPWVGLTMSLTILSLLGLIILGMALAWLPPSLSAPPSSSPHTRSRQRVLQLPRLSMPIVIILLATFLWVGLHGDLTFRVEAAGSSQEVVFQREDASGVVEVFANRDTGERALFTSRLRQEGGSSTEDVRVQRLQGYLPILLHPHPQKALVIGLGTGITASSYLRDEIQQLTIVEISPGIIEASALFDQESGHILSHSKTRIVRQDGRNFMKLSRQQFDLIVQELFFPYQSGVGSLYTLEHYQRIRERLAPGGMVGQWITINQLGLEDLRTLIHTFQTVFPHTSLWLHGGYLLLCAGLEPLSIEFSNLSYRFYQDDALGGLVSLGSDPYDLLSRFVTQGKALQDWVSDVALNTDDNRRIEYSAPLSFAKLNTTDLAADTLEAFLPLLRPLSDIVQTLHASTEFNPRKLTQVSQASALLLQGIIARTHAQHEQAETLYAQALEHNPTSYQIKTFLEPLWAGRGRTLLLKGEYEEASRWLHKAFNVNDKNPDVLFDLGLLASQDSDDRLALTFYTQLLDDFPDWHQRLTVTFNLGLSHYRMKDYARAAKLFQTVARAEPDSVNAHFNLANSLAQTGEYEQAAMHYRTVLRLAPDHKQAQENYVELIEWVKSKEADASQEVESEE